MLRSRPGVAMAKGPKGEKRPADVIGNAVKVMRIATGEISETTGDEGKNPAAVARGRAGGPPGGRARALALTAEQRAEIARVAAQTRWKKSK
jgi:hypothetical protein